MNEEKNIMKYAILFFDNSMNASVHVYMSLETLNKIKKGSISIRLFNIQTANTLSWKSSIKFLL